MKKKRIILTNNVIGSVYIKCKGKCFKCISIEDIEIHHIDHNPCNNQIDNLILLCKFCHKLIHKSEGKKEIYDEQSVSQYLDKLPKMFEYSNEHNWKVSWDTTDHFSFECPKCNKQAIVYNIKIWDNGLVGNDICPCFYFYLKCSECKIKGQRKSYLNYHLLNDCNERWRKKYGRTNISSN